MSSTLDTAAPLWPLLAFFILILGLIALMLVVAWALGEHGDHRRVEHPFESGILPVGHARFCVSVGFHVVAMFFVLFDLETVFLLAWAIAFREVGWAGYAVAVIFIVELLVGLIYVWRLGALDWGPRNGRAVRTSTGLRS